MFVLFYSLRHVLVSCVPFLKFLISQIPRPCEKFGTDMSHSAIFFGKFSFVIEGVGG